jgi:serine/threonine protein kinase/formylglycine-generating enzyme required for sulfatase activity/dienelactone hydrolase
MTPQRWSRIREVFGAALEIPESERRQFLESACGGDTDLRAEVERLLVGNDEPSWQSPATKLFAAAAELAPGDTVAHYRIDAKLGEGGMGVVYRVYDTRLHREVALKVLPPEHLADPELRQRLTREARAASALNHSNIVTVYEIGSERDLDFIAMEYVDGQPLAHAIPAKGLPLARALDYAGQIAAALTKAHAAGVVHRDLKPANIMLTGEGHIKLLDFGLAGRVPLAESGTATLTAEGEISGTVGYMSPEQVRGLPVNHGTDLFSFGVVLYEMLTGERPFIGSSARAVCDAILGAPPCDFGDTPVPGRLKAIVGKLLEKDPANRYGSADQVQQELKALERSLARTSPVRLSRNAWITVGAAVVLIGVLGGWLWHASLRARWALETAAPEIGQLLDAGEYVKAAALTREARGVLPKDPTLEKLWMRATGEVSIASVPSGAEVWLRSYRGDPNSWMTLGKTPLEKLRVPREAYVWRLQKPGFAPDFFIREPAGVPPPGFHSVPYPTFKLRPERSVPREMVVVAGGRVGLAYPLAQAPATQVDDFLIDRHEVTNEQYKRFVDAGGYQRRDFWKEPFLKHGRAVRWEDAIAAFHDATGRPGPATWEAGDYPKGREKYPVAGVSWYEATAYAEFVGKSLPTAYHWTVASQSAGYTPLITSGSNFRHDGTQRVGSESALSGFGTTDMAGNVKEWVWNETRDAKRLILGGGIGEPTYMFNYTDAQSPWDRRANFGFRCVKLDSPASATAVARVEVTVRDYWIEKPVSDDVFKAYTALYAYDKGELNAVVEETATMEGWSREKVTFDAAYGHERLPAYLFLPKNASPPFQMVVFFPGGYAYSDDKLNLTSIEDGYDFLVKSGRALIIPIYKGTYERRDGLPPDLKPPAFFRDHAIAWAKDLGRSLDYLETRKDIDTTKVAYLGFSAGAAQALLLPTVEKRIKAAILSSGGFQLTVHYLPEADPFNFVSHLTIPVLMLNGRYDSAFPLESSQLPLFSFLGSPAHDKKHVIYEGGHGAFPRPAAVRECLDWLDKYLGPVRH